MVITAIHALMTWQMWSLANLAFSQTFLKNQTSKNKQIKPVNALTKKIEFKIKITYLTKKSIFGPDLGFA